MNKPVVRVWLILAIPLALMLAGVVGGAMRGDYKAVPLVIAALWFAALFFWFSRARLRRMFRDQTPDRIIAYYHTTARRVPHANASAAYLSAIAAAAYGQFDRARSELASIDWSAFPPLYQGYRLHAMAIITLLEKRDFEGALQLLHEAREVASAGTSDSGSASAKAAFAIYEAIIESASGGGDHATAKLEEMANRRRGLISAFSAWALALHFRHAGEPDRAVPFQQLVRDITPNCAPLNEFSTALPG